MSVRLRISLVFILVVGAILALFGAYVYLHSERLRADEFYERLHERAELALKLVREAKHLPQEERDNIERTLQGALPDESLAILDARDSLVFEQSASSERSDKASLANARKVRLLRMTRGDRQYFLVSPPDGDGLVASASAVDVDGLGSMNDLHRALVVGSLFMILLTGAVAYAYATWTLAPVRHVVSTAAGIREPSQRIPVAESHREDELGQIATTFNALLARLEDAFQVQRSFIAAASHELRTPLTVVRGEVQQALRSPEVTGELRERLIGVDAQAVRIQDLLGQLLWLARTYAEGEALPRTTVRMDEVAERAMADCRQRFPDRPVILSFEEPGEDFEPMVTGSRVLLTAALYNLLCNAAKYGGEGPVTLSIAEDVAHVRVSVSDRGPGIPAEALAHVRELFYRASDQHSSDGHGIGLALVDRIAQVHHGQLEIRTAPSGTTAIITLPAAH